KIGDSTLTCRSVNKVEGASRLPFAREADMSSSTALVSAAGGIGDILRVTPLIRVFASLGYEVDVLLAPDYLDTVKLLEGAPPIRRLFYLPSSWCSDKRQSLDGLDQQIYDIATFTLWSATLQRFVL